MIIDEFRRIKILLNVVRIPESEDKLRAMSALATQANSAMQDRKNLKTALQMRQAENAPHVLPASPATPHFSDQQIHDLVARLREEKIEAMEELQDRVLKIDNSNAFISYHGCQALLEALRSNDLETRQLAAMIASVVVQNNPNAQTNFCGTPTFYALIDLLQLHPEQKQLKTEKSIRDVPFTERTNAGYALIKSALFYIRSQLENHESSQVEFVNGGGLSTLLNLASDISPIAAVILAKAAKLGIETEEGSALTRSPAVAALRAIYAILSLLLDLTHYVTFTLEDLTTKTGLNGNFEKLVHKIVETAKTGVAYSHAQSSRGVPISPVPGVPISASTELVEIADADGADANVKEERAGVKKSPNFHGEHTNKDDKKEMMKDKFSSVVDRHHIPISAVVREVMAQKLDFDVLTLMIRFGDASSRATAQKLIFNYLLSGSPSSKASAIPVSTAFRSSLSAKLGTSISGGEEQSSFILSNPRGALVQRLQTIQLEVANDPHLKSDFEEEMSLVASAIQVYDDLLAGKKMTARDFTQEIKK